MNSVASDCSPTGELSRHLVPVCEESLDLPAGPKRPKLVRTGRKMLARTSSQDTSGVMITRRKSSVQPCPTGICSSPPNLEQLCARLDSVQRKLLDAVKFREVSPLIYDVVDWDRSVELCDFFRNLEQEGQDLNQLQHAEVEDRLYRQNERLYRWVYHLSGREKRFPSDPAVKMLSAWNDYYAILYRDNATPELHENYFHWRQLIEPTVERVCIERDKYFYDNSSSGDATSDGNKISLAPPPRKRVCLRDVSGGADPSAELGRSVLGVVSASSDPSTTQGSQVYDAVNLSTQVTSLKRKFAEVCGKIPESERSQCERVFQYAGTIYDLYEIRYNSLKKKHRSLLEKNRELSGKNSDHEAAMDRYVREQHSVLLREKRKLELQKDLLVEENRSLKQENSKLKKKSQDMVEDIGCLWKRVRKIQTVRFDLSNGDSSSSS